MTKNSKSTVLGSIFHDHKEIVKEILSKQLQRKYTFKGVPEKLSPNDIQWFNKCYVDEILYRAHYGALVALNRTLDWCNAIEACESAGNYLGTAAALRSLLESAADINYTFNLSVATIARNFSDLLAVRVGEKHMHLEELENALIHFGHGRKINSTERDAVPRSHHAETNATYIRSIAGKKPAVWNLYGDLCEVCHPAASTVWHYLSEQSSQNADTLVTFTGGSDAGKINQLGTTYRAEIDFLIEIGFSLPLIQLGVLNQLGIPSVATAAVTVFNFDRIPAWRKLMRDIEKSRARHASGPVDNVVPFVPTPNKTRN